LYHHLGVLYNITGRKANRGNWKKEASKRGESGQNHHVGKRASFGKDWKGFDSKGEKGLKETDALPESTLRCLEGEETWATPEKKEGGQFGGE